MYTKRGNVKITKIISDLRDAVVDLKKVVLFESVTGPLTFSDT